MTNIIEKDGLKFETTRILINEEEIERFKAQIPVKFIFLNEDFKDLSSDTSVNEIHKFKSKYRGNTYIRVPLKIQKEDEENKYPSRIHIIEEEKEADGFAVLSKHDIRDMAKEMKYADKAKRVGFGKDVCEEAVMAYNMLLDADAFNVKVYKDSTLISETFVLGKTFEYDGTTIVLK